MILEPASGKKGCGFLIWMEFFSEQIMQINEGNSRQLRNKGVLSR